MSAIERWAARSASPGLDRGGDRLGEDLVAGAAHVAAVVDVGRLGAVLLDERQVLEPDAGSGSFVTGALKQRVGLGGERPVAQFGLERDALLLLGEWPRANDVLIALEEVVVHDPDESPNLRQTEDEAQRLRERLQP